MLSKFCGLLDYRWSRSRIKIPPLFFHSTIPRTSTLLSCLFPTAPSPCSFCPFRLRLNSHFSPAPSRYFTPQSSSFMFLANLVEDKLPPIPYPYGNPSLPFLFCPHHSLQLLFCPHGGGYRGGRQNLAPLLRFRGKKCFQFATIIFLIYLIVCTHFSRII